MSDPRLALHDGILGVLKASAAVSALVAQRVYDGVPVNAPRPYLKIDAGQLLPDKADCVDGASVVVTVHAWSNGPATVEIKQLADAVIAALDADEFGDPRIPAVAGHRVVSLELEQAESVEDPDPETQHAVIVFRALTEPA
jgi:hypothetical protein